MEVLKEAAAAKRTARFIADCSVVSYFCVNVAGCSSGRRLVNEPLMKSMNGAADESALHAAVGNAAVIAGWSAC